MKINKFLFMSLSSIIYCNINYSVSNKIIEYSVKIMFVLQYMRGVKYETRNYGRTAKTFEFFIYVFAE